MNTNNNITSGIYCICNLEGQIIDVLFDDLNLIEKSALPIPLFNIFRSDNLSKAAVFWSDVIKKQFVFDHELFVNSNETDQSIKFSAAIIGGQVWVIASTKDEILESLLSELMLINNEQQNLIRMAEKRLSKIHRQDDIDTQIADHSTGNDTIENEDLSSTEAMFDELSHLNNELINAQRKLIKQNEHIIQLNKSLKETNQELEHFAYSISHDLKAPLRSVKQFLNLLNKRMGTELDEKSRKYVSMAATGAENMQKLIDELLEYSRIGRIEQANSNTNLTKIVDEVLSMISADINDKNALVTYDNLPIATVPTAPFRQLMLNLLSNALKFSSPQRSPEIHIGKTESNDKWTIYVSDNGIGMNQQDTGIIFNIFRRLPGSEKIDGTGMGLAICKKIVSIWKGEIWAESEPDRGSTFYFTIPK